MCFKHNSYLGHVKTIAIHLTEIINSPTTTADSKDYARLILADLPTLAESLHERDDTIFNEVT